MIEDLEEKIIHTRNILKNTYRNIKNHPNDPVFEYIKASMEKYLDTLIGEPYGPVIKSGDKH